MKRCAALLQRAAVMERLYNRKTPGEQSGSWEGRQFQCSRRNLHDFWVFLLECAYWLP
jgi:hypothetical protein